VFAQGVGKQSKSRSHRKSERKSRSVGQETWPRDDSVFVLPHGVRHAQKKDPPSEYEGGAPEKTKKKQIPRPGNLAS
jgi:hypothetical protein